ncbi:MAG: MBOAT family protein [Spirochaetia bacterium]|nr:MBOAT family protein [Spirochaetia bacterium]
MNFTSFHFVLFFFITILLGHILKGRNQRVFLLAASYYFYGVFNTSYLFLIWISTLWDFISALGIEASGKKKNHSPLDLTLSERFLSAVPAKVWLFISIALNLSLLGYFKYTNFGIEIFNDLYPLGDSVFSWPNASILLPVGISFYTFQSMSYTIDVYRGILTPRKNIIDFALYVAFFPQLVAGPIVRATTFLKELDNRLPINRDDIIVGTTRIVVGFFRKLVLSDNLALMVNHVFAHPASVNPVDVWIASLAFGFQIYLDFAGYTDIARGVARLFGFEFEINFHYPMAAKNITEHWSRWHISLTTWIRDYIYIPLGGSRMGEFRTYTNIFLTWFFAGIWHGPAYHFVVWGIWQGVMISAHRLFQRTSLRKTLNEKGGFFYDFFTRAFTIFNLIFGFIWFRAENMTTATILQGRLFGINNLPLLLKGEAGGLADTFPPAMYLSYTGMLAFLFAYEYFFYRYQLEFFWKKENQWKLIFILTAMIFSIVVFSPPETPSFMYFQF